LRRLAGLFGGALLGSLAFGSTGRAKGCGPHEFKCNGVCCSKALYSCCSGGVPTCGVWCGNGAIGSSAVCCRAGFCDSSTGTCGGPL
jgi:hypothetical protein